MPSHSRPIAIRSIQVKLVVLLTTLAATPGFAVDLDARGIPRGAAVTPTHWCLGVGDSRLYDWQLSIAELLGMGGVVHGIAHDTNGNRLSYFALVCAPRADAAAQAR
jgi:hypothetical protein